METNKIAIKTTESQILIIVNDNTNMTYPKNSLKYRASDSELYLYLVGESNILYSAKWGNITIDGTIVTKQNVNTMLEALFI